MEENSVRQLYLISAATRLIDIGDGVLVMCGQCETFCSMRYAMQCLTCSCFFHRKCAALPDICQDCWNGLNEIDVKADGRLEISRRPSKTSAIVLCIQKCENERVKCIGGGTTNAFGTKYRYKCTNCNAYWQQFPPGKEANGDPCITTRRYKQ